MESDTCSVVSRWIFSLLTCGETVHQMSQDASAFFLLILPSVLGLDFVLCGRDLLADDGLDHRHVPHDLLKSPPVLNASAAGSDPLRIKYGWGES